MMTSKKRELLMGLLNKDTKDNILKKATKNDLASLIVSLETDVRQEEKDNYQIEIAKLQSESKSAMDKIEHQMHQATKRLSDIDMLNIRLQADKDELNKESTRLLGIIDTLTNRLRRFKLFFSSVLICELIFLIIYLIL